MTSSQDVGPAWTEIADHGADGITIRGFSLEDDLIGRVSYTEVLALSVLGHRPDPKTLHMLDSCMIALMEGGLNLSTVVTRLVSESAPSDPQTAMAAGLLTVGEVYVGSVQEAALCLRTVAGSEDTEAAAHHVVEEFARRGEKVPGLGHGRHQSEDPRATKLIALAESWECAGEHLAALHALRTAVEQKLGKTLVINVTGAVAGALLDTGFPVEAIRPIALAARSGGLVSHVVEERARPIAAGLWKRVRDDARYRGPTGTKPSAGRGNDSEEDQ